MADAVHFLTYEDTGTPANSSGVNGFPAPFNDGSAEPEYYPFIVPFTDVIKWYWRVKNWTLATDLDADGNPAPTGATTIVTGPASEIDLVQPQFLRFSIANADFTFTFTFFNSAVDRQPAIKYDDPVVSPSFYITGDYGAGQVLFDSRPSELPTVDGTILVYIDGYLVELAFYYVAAPVTINYTTFTLNPVEYWPYAAADASPIYNTTTGAQLQDPRN